jgi:cation diffusion facilitator CzcD-associated flavoprotein CzcO
VPVVSVLGAGPFGLAATAHLKAIGVDVRVFGEPMSFWAGHMPAGMLLRSPRIASSISDPAGKLDLDGFAAATGVPVGSPVPLETFIQYGRWFQTQAVPEVDRRRVEQVQRAKGRFMLTLADGERVTTARVIVAAGIAAFAHVPRAFRGLPTELVSHASQHTDFGRLSGRRVLVVGCGQSALESAALLHEHGAEVDIVARAPAVRWLNQRRWLRELGPVSTLLYAPPEVGPPLLSQLVRVPGLVHRMPSRSRHAVDRRSIRPAGAGWLKPRIDGKVTIQNGQFVTAVEPAGERVAVTFNDGGRDIVDHVLLGTGYRIDLARYPFLNGDLLREVHQVNGYPALRRGCESSVPGLHFIGSTGAWTYGPLMRFVAGTPFVAAEVARFVAAATRRSARSANVRT